MQSNTIKGVMAVIGGFLLHFSFGTLHTFGNMNSYIASYLKFKSDSKHGDYSTTGWIYAFSIVGLGFMMVTGGLIQKKMGSRFSCFVGSLIMSSGVGLTYFSIKSSVFLVMITYGLMFGVGLGLAYGVAISTVMSWFPDYKGLVSGFVLAGFAGGASVFDVVQTKFINPDNLPPNISSSHDMIRYFDDPGILSRIPDCFLLLAGSYAAMQILGILLISEPESNDLMDLLTPNEERPDSSLNENSISSQSIYANMSVRRILCSRGFWILWFTMLFNSIGTFFVSTFYKVFGASFIHDDLLLAWVGSMASVFNTVCRVLWGMIADKFSFKLLMHIQTACMFVMLLTFFLSMAATPFMYVIWVCALFGLLSGNYVLFPVVCANSFGRDKFTVNYGLIFTSQIASGVFSAFLSTILLYEIDFVGIFSLGAGFCGLSFILIFFFKERPSSPSCDSDIQ